MKQTQLTKTRQRRNGRSQRILDLHDPTLYFNRELSALDFQEEVLEEALDRSHPLLERLKLLCIVAANLDEFFMIRVAALKEQIEAGIVEPTPDRIPPHEQLQRIRKRLLDLYARHERALLEDVLPALAAEGIRIVSYADLTEAQRVFFRQYFMKDAFPVLTPLILDPASIPAFAQSKYQYCICASFYNRRRGTCYWCSAVATGIAAPVADSWPEGLCICAA